ncbi:hypothetical protein PROVRETT_07683 [Providencia rettgeri DSM 1131]|nr:hypothetical protein PROVRETT_07683 [Providencia rettgeri DSM 1131]
MMNVTFNENNKSLISPLSDLHHIYSLVLFLFKIHCHQYR